MSEPAPLPPVAVLAGGVAKRLRPLSLTIPKSLVKIAGRPFIDHQMELLRRQGACKVVICCGYLGEQIEEHLGDGAEYGLGVSYSYDGNELLGTGGAIKKALPQLGDVSMVLYGDSYLPIAFRPIADAFRMSDAGGLMTLFRNDGRWDTSNVEFNDGIIRSYDKINRTAAMRHIDYGLSVFRREEFNAWPADKPFDLAAMLQALLAAGRLKAFEVNERFYEIGSPAGIEEIERFILERERDVASTSQG
jgi:N-acetyl-alpha-D-muramate 1-phosphate uridylyltransferase